MGMVFREADFVQAPPISCRRHPPCRLAVLPFQPEFSGRRGTDGAARNRGQLRDDPVLDDQVWASLRQAAEEAARGPLAALASRRDGLLDRRKASISVACSRRRRRGPGSRGPAPAGHRGGAEASPTPATQPAGGAGDDHDRRSLVLWRGAQPARSSPPSSTRPASGEQSSGELPPPDPTARTPASAVQIASLSPEISHHPRGDLQHLQHPATSDQQTHSSALSCRGGFRLGGGGCLISGRVGRFSTWRS